MNGIETRCVGRQDKTNGKWKMDQWWLEDRWRRPPSTARTRRVNDFGRSRDKNAFEEWNGSRCQVYFFLSKLGFFKLNNFPCVSRMGILSVDHTVQLHIAVLTRIGHIQAVNVIYLDIVYNSPHKWVSTILERPMPFVPVGSSSEHEAEIHVDSFGCSLIHLCLKLAQWSRIQRPDHESCNQGSK